MPTATRNAAACKMLGYTHDELVGLHTSSVATQLGLATVEPAQDTSGAEQVVSREWQFRRKDGSVFSAEVMATMLLDGKLMGIIHDVSERKQAELYARRNLGLKTIAEGVETMDLLEYLRNNGCDEAQGFHFSKPVPAKQLEEYLIANNA